MTFLPLIIYVLVGAVAGFLGGLLGIGGGLVTVPALLVTFTLLGFPEASSMRVAIGTSLGAMVFTSCVSAISHLLRNGIYWPLFRTLTPGIVVGAVLNALLAKRLSGNELKLLFGFFECVCGLYFCFFRQKKRVQEFKIPNFLILFVIGLGVGALSTLLGIGGGLVTLPILLSFGTPMKNAIATSAAMGFFTAIVGTVSFLLIGLHEKTFEGAIGYLYVPAFITIGIASMLAVPLGVKLTYRLPTSLLKRIFGVILILAGISMFY